MKYIILAAYLLLSTFCFSQKDEKFTEASLKKIFAKIPESKYVDLVPYMKNNRWGFIDRTSKKIMIKPLFYSPEFFDPYIRTYIEGKMVNIYQNGLISVEKENQETGLISAEVPPEADNSGHDPKAISSRDGFKGFKVTNTGNLIAYSDLYEYNKQGISGWNIQIIKYKAKFYGVVKNLKAQAGIIDTEGNPLKGFEFNYHDIIPNRNTKDTMNAWFFVKKTETENYSLVNTKGEVKARNEIFSYPLLSSEIFGYTVYNKGDSSGIFDRYTMTWVVKPQMKLPIVQVYFSSREELDYNLPENRRKAFMYYHVRDKKTEYFMDFKGNKYLPKE